MLKEGEYFKRFNYKTFTKSFKKALQKSLKKLYKSSSMLCEDFIKMFIKDLWKLYQK